MKFVERFLPPLIVLLAAGYLIWTLVPARNAPEQMQIAELARIPVQFNDRIQPLDSEARTLLMIISDRQVFREVVSKDKEGRAKYGPEQPAIRWLLDVMAKPKLADNYHVFRIENDQLWGLLGLEERPGLRYSYNEMQPKLKNLRQPMEVAQRKPRDERTAFDNKVLDLASQLEYHGRLREGFLPRWVPPEADGGQWMPLVDPEQKSGEPAPAGGEEVRNRLASLLEAYAHDDAPQFNRLLAEHARAIGVRFPDLATHARLEEYFNHTEPFYQCCILYVPAFLLAALGWLGWSRPLWRAGFWLIALILVFHTLAIGARMYLYGRPPITSLYSSALFIGWGAVVLGVILELLFRNGLGTTLGAVIGFLTMVVAINLGGADNMDLLEPVLDTNFWLATHVTAVTIGYTATFVAGALGIAFILQGFFSANLDKTAMKRLTSMTYGVVCFAMFFSFVGTVLGGIWADQSWGRFWGWDTKENGALLIVVWNALVLHSRWGGMVRQRGIAVLTVSGNIVTAWSWFGVNQLGVGLHSYGFTQSATAWIVVFVVTQLGIIGIGLMPKRMWQSYRAQQGLIPTADLAASEDSIPVLHPNM